MTNSSNTGIHHYQLDEMEARLAAEAAISRREAAEKEAERVVRHCEARMADAEAEAEAAEKSARERAKAAQQSANDAIAASRAASKDARQQHDHLAADLLARERTIRNRIRTCTAVARSQVGRGKKLKSRIAELERRSAMIADQVDRRESELDALQKRKSDIEANIAALQAQASAERSQTEQLTRERQHAESNLEATRATLSRTQADVQSAQSDLRSVMVRVHEETVNVVRQREELTRLTHESEALTAKIHRLQQQAEDARQTLEQQQKITERDYQAAQDRLRNVRAAAADVLNRVADGERILADTRDEIRQAIRNGETRCQDLWSEANRARQAALEAEQRRLNSERDALELTSKLSMLRRAIDEAEQEAERSRRLMDDRIEASRQELSRLGRLSNLEQAVSDNLNHVHLTAEDYADLRNQTVELNDDEMELLLADTSDSSYRDSLDDLPASHHLDLNGLDEVEESFNTYSFAPPPPPPAAVLPVAPVSPLPPPPDMDSDLASIQEYAARLFRDLGDDLKTDLPSRDEDDDTGSSIETSFLTRLALREGR